MENELRHYGVLGMRWGKRKSNSDTVSLKNKHNSDRSVKEERKAASKNRRTLSDTELKKRIERMELERKMKDLTDKDIAPGRKAVNEILSNSGKKVATTVLTGATLYAVKAGLEGKVNLKEAASYLAPKPKHK